MQRENNNADEFSKRYFENRSCEYYPCHNLDSMNCLFCYCPMYNYSDCPGDNYYKDKNGKKVKVCTNCTFPHQPDNYDYIIQFLKEHQGVSI